MANEIQCVYITGTTIYAVILSAAGQAWNGAAFDVLNGAAFEALNGANWANYAVTLTEQISAGVYFATFPAGITTPGRYGIGLYLQGGGSSAVTDSCIGNGPITWDGTAEVTALNTLLAPSEHTAISGTDVPAALTSQGLTSARAAKLDNADVAVSTAVTAANNATTAATTAAATAAAIKTETDNLPTQPASKSDVHTTVVVPH